MAIDMRFQAVTCSRCQKTYTCTPMQDYYHTDPDPETWTQTNGFCWDCLMVETDMAPRPEPTPENPISRPEGQQ